jgi:putative membrane protein
LLLEHIFFLASGILLGVCTGLLPGLHVNTVGTIFLSAFPLLGLDPFNFAIMLTATATVHTFLDFIPSIFLGVPEESTALSILPSHKLFLEGRAMEAVKITGLASLYGVVISLLMLPAAFIFIPSMNSLLRPVMAPFLISIVFLLVLRERSIEKIAWASFIIFLSGSLGYLSLNHLSTLSSNQIFLALFSGLFGLSTLLLGFWGDNTIRIQKPNPDLKISKKDLIKQSFLGSVGGLLVGVLPAVSPSQISIAFQELSNFRIRAKERIEDVHPRRFLTMIGSLNTADAMFSIFALYLIGNPRSGASVMIQSLLGSLDFSVFIALIIVMLVSGIIAYFIHLEIGARFASLTSQFDFRKVSVVAFIFILILIFILAGPMGILTSLVALTVGLIPPLVGVSRTHTMGVLLIPSIIFFLSL